MKIFYAIILILLMGGIGIASVLESPRGNANKKVKKENKILVFGNASLFGKLKKMGLDSEYSPTRPYINKLGEYYAVLALSDDDVENMRICVETAHVDGGILTIMRCNDTTYLPALKEANVKHIVSKDVTAEELAHILMKKK